MDRVDVVAWTITILFGAVAGLALAREIERHRNPPRAPARFGGG